MRRLSNVFNWQMAVAPLVLRDRRLSIFQLKGLILAQNERWRRGLGMQVERKGPFGGTRAAQGRVTRG